MLHSVYHRLMETRIRNIPPDMWKKFKHLCIEQDISVNKKLLQLVRKEVERNEKKK